MAAVSTTDVQHLSKVLFPKGYKDKDLYQGLPLTASMKKVPDFTSARGIEVPVDIALANGQGGTMAGAVANATASSGTTFTVPQVSWYGYANINGKVWRNAQAGGDDAKFIDYAKKQFTDGMHALMQDVERMAFRRKTGSIGRVSATTAPSGAVVTLEDASLCLLFRKGMRVVASGTDGGALKTGTPGYMTVLKVDFSAATITVDGTATTLIATLGTGDHLYRYSQADDNGNGNGGFAGLGDWNPITPSSSFYGVDQTVCAPMLAGVRTTDTSNVEMIFPRAEAKAQGEVGADYRGGEVFIHPWQFQALVSSKMHAVKVTDPKSVELGISKMTLGDFTFVKAPYCPVSSAHMIGDNNLELHTCGKQPEIGKAFEDPDVDEVKVKLNLDGNILTFSPCRNTRVALPSVSIS